MLWKDFKPYLFNTAWDYRTSLWQQPSDLARNFFPCLNSFFADKVKPILLASFCTLKFHREFHKFKIDLTQYYSMDTAGWVPGHLSQEINISLSPSLKVGPLTNLAVIWFYSEVKCTQTRMRCFLSTFIKWKVLCSKNCSKERLFLLAPPPSWCVTSEGPSTWQLSGRKLWLSVKRPRSS